MNAKGLLPALLLAAAGCTVNTNDLAPKSEAQCAASGEKACGYKCVRVDDPATGCGEPGCSPCSARGLAFGPHTVPACTTLNECGYACAAGWGDCNGSPLPDGCEAPLGDDPSNCGACFRACGAATCSGGQCAAEVLDMSGVGEPRGIVSGPTSIYWVVEGSGGRMYRWDHSAPGAAFAFASAILLASGLDPANSEAVFRLAREDGGTVLFASGATATGDLAIFKIDPTAIGTTPVPTFARAYSLSHAVLGLAPTGGYVFFSTNADDGVHWITGQTMENSIPTAAPVYGLTPLAGGVLFGLNGQVPGAESAVSWLGSSSLTVQPYLPTPGTWAARIALFPDAISPTHVFWADESTGAVYATDFTQSYTLDVGNLAPSAMDIAADPSGVVWSSSRGVVRAWRAADGLIMDLPTRGGPPLGVALTRTHVYWTEGGPSLAVLRVPK